MICSSEMGLIRDLLPTPMKRLVLISLLLPIAATADQPRARWSFAWDSHPQAAVVDHFELEVMTNTRTWIVRVVGGTVTMVRDVFIDPALAGNASAVLRACRANNECSANSNRVDIDRTPPRPPGALFYDTMR